MKKLLKPGYFRMSKDSLKPAKVLKNTVPYVLLGLLFTDVGKALRLSEGNDSGEKLLSFYRNIRTVFFPPVPSFHLFDMLCGALFGVTVWLIVYVRSYHSRTFRPDKEYGSARWSA